MTDAGQARAVRRLVLSHGLAAVAMSVPWPLLLVLVWDRVEHDPRGDLLLGLTGAARMLPYVLLSWATGALADRLRRDRLVRATLVTRMLLLCVVAVAVWQGWLLAAVLAATATIAAGTPAYPAIAAAMPQLAGAGCRRATNLLVTVEVASFVVGPAVGGLLLAPSTRALVPAAAVVLAAVAALLATAVEVPRAVRSAGRVRPPSPLGTAVRTRAVRRSVAAVALLNAVDSAVALALLPLATLGWRDGGAGYGLATGLLGFGALGAPLLWWLGSSAHARARLGLVLLGVALLVVPVGPGVAWALAPLAVVGAASVHVESAVTETIQDAVPDDRRAGILGLTDSVMVGAALVGSLAAPWLSSLLGAHALFVLLAVLCLAAVVVPVRHARHVGAGSVPWVPRQRTAERAQAPARHA